MDIELVTDPYACMMYGISCHHLQAWAGECCGGFPPIACSVLFKIQALSEFCKIKQWEVKTVSVPHQEENQDLT